MTRIAVVDDNEDILAITGNFLRESCDTVVLYASPEELIKDLELGMELDLVITDFYMFGMNGAELLDAIAAMGRRIPGIIVTGHPEGAASIGSNVLILCKGTDNYFKALLNQVNLLLNRTEHAPA